MIGKILRLLPIKIANSLVAHFVLKNRIKYLDKYYSNVELRHSSSIKMNLNKSDIGHQYLAFTGVYESDLTKKILAIKTKKNGLMVDVGANYGYYSLLWSDNAKYNKTICFEASPKNLCALEENIKLNNLESQIILEKLAVSEKFGKIYFDMGPEDQTGWGGISLSSFGKSTIEVDTISLDQYFDKKNEHIQILKIDTEGADYLVLKGAKSLISQKKISNIFWEENVGRAQQLGLVGGEAGIFLLEAGYKINQIGENEFHAFLQNTKKLP